MYPCILHGLGSAPACPLIAHWPGDCTSGVQPLRPGNIGAALYNPREIVLICRMSAPHHPQIAALYADHHGWLQGWLRRRLGDACDAADLAQDTFVRLIARPRAFDSGPQVRAYLRTVANGLCIDLWRHREIERAWLETLAAQPEAFAPSAQEQVAILQALYEVDNLLRRLPPKAARAFILTTACGMTHQEAAREIGVSSRMIGNYITQAMLHCMQLEARVLAQGDAAP